VTSSALVYSVLTPPDADTRCAVLCCGLCCAVLCCAVDRACCRSTSLSISCRRLQAHQQHTPVSTRLWLHLGSTSNSCSKHRRQQHQRSSRHKLNTLQRLAPAASLHANSACRSITVSFICPLVLDQPCAVCGNRATVRCLASNPRLHERHCVVARQVHGALCRRGVMCAHES
jgi:hypothetical protein